MILGFRVFGLSLLLRALVLSGSISLMLYEGRVLTLGLPCGVPTIRFMYPLGSILGPKPYTLNSIGKLPSEAPHIAPGNFYFQRAVPNAEVLRFS